MIKILFTNDVKKRMIKELKNAGSREIGGVLMGEHVEEHIFRICDFTTQQQGGTWITFVRQIEKSLKFSLRKFFQDTNFEYTRFNYLGEWHSHPSFSLIPSRHDEQSMWEIVNDPFVGANFAILLIVKLEKDNLTGNVNLFVPGFSIMQGDLIFEEDSI